MLVYNFSDMQTNQVIFVLKVVKLNYVLVEKHIVYFNNIVCNFHSIYLYKLTRNSIPLLVKYLFYTNVLNKCTIYINVLCMYVFFVISCYNFCLLNIHTWCVPFLKVIKHISVTYAYQLFMFCILNLQDKSFRFNFWCLNT